MATKDGGLAAVAFGPSKVATSLRGELVSIEEQTEYPFRDSVTFAIKLAKSVSFPLVLRIPAWAEGATVAVNGEAQSGVAAGAFYRLDRKWNNGDRVGVRFPMRVRTSTWYNNSVAVERGPLVYSLKIGESWHKVKQTGPAADWEVYPVSPWNYALVLDPKRPADWFTVKENAVSKQPFDPNSPALEIAAKARRLPAWQLVDDSAGPLPASPVKGGLSEETITLIPYGAGKLRITAFPYTLPGASEIAK
jgi:hypothetical protein